MKQKKGDAAVKLMVHTEDISNYLKEMYALYEEQEDVIKKHMNVMRDIQDYLALEDLAALQFELREVERRGKEFVEEKMQPLHETLIRSKPVEPFTEAIDVIQQFLQENDIPTFTRAIREIQPVNRTTTAESKGTIPRDAVALEGLDMSNLYKAFNGQDPFTGEKLDFGQWKETVGWSILTVVPPASLVKGNLNVGKAAQGNYPLRTTKAMAANEKLTQLGKLGEPDAKTADEKEKAPSQTEIDQFMRLRSEERRVGKECRDV